MRGSRHGRAHPPLDVDLTAWLPGCPVARLPTPGTARGQASKVPSGDGGLIWHAEILLDGASCDAILQLLNPAFSFDTAPAPPKYRGQHQHHAIHQFTSFHGGAKHMKYCCDDAGEDMGPPRCEDGSLPIKGQECPEGGAPNDCDGVPAESTPCRPLEHKRGAEPDGDAEGEEDVKGEAEGVAEGVAEGEAEEEEPDMDEVHEAAE